MIATGNKHIQEHLESERKRLTTELEGVATSASSSEERREGSPFGKREEEATETLELEKRLTIENRIRTDLSAVEHALDKINKGKFGLCSNCGQPIHPGRLEALPQAKYCMNCKALLANHGHSKPPAI